MIREIETRLAVYGYKLKKENPDSVYSLGLSDRVLSILYDVDIQTIEELKRTHLLLIWEGCLGLVSGGLEQVQAKLKAYRDPESNDYKIHFKKGAQDSIHFEKELPDSIYSFRVK